MIMGRHERADDVAVGYVHAGKQGSRPMPYVIARQRSCRRSHAGKSRAMSSSPLTAEPYRVEWCRQARDDSGIRSQSTSPGWDSDEHCGECEVPAGTVERQASAAPQV